MPRPRAVKTTTAEPEILQPERKPAATSSTAVSTERRPAPAVLKKGKPGAKPDAFTSLVRELAFTPGVNIDVVERVLALQERKEAKEAKRAFEVAFHAMAPELPVIVKGGEVFASEAKGGGLLYKHSKFEDIHKAVMPIVLRHGFNIHFETDTSPTASSAVTFLTHVAGGHSRSTSYTVARDDGPGRNAAQSVMSATSYCKRHGLVTVLNLREVGSDDDGASAAAGPDERRTTVAGKRLEELADKTKKKPAAAKADAPAKGTEKPFPGDEGRTPAERRADAKPAAGAPEKAPDPADEPDAFFEFVEKRVKGCTMRKPLTALWDVYIEPNISKIFETDFDKIRTLFNTKRESLPSDNNRMAG